MKIQLTKTKTIEWIAPWEKNLAAISDVVGIELESNNPEGCPAVRLQRTNEGLTLAMAGFIPPPPNAMPTDWDELGASDKWAIPSAFRAEHAAIAFNSPDAFTRQTAIAAIQEISDTAAEGVAFSKDGMRLTFRNMADSTSALQAGVPEYQALWISRLFGDRRRPIMHSAQTAVSATLSSLTALPGFCENNDEFAVFIFETGVFLASYRGGIPMLYRDCPGIPGTGGMRDAVKRAFGVDDSMIDAIFANNGLIDTRPAIAPLLMPVVAQIELSIDYLKNRLGANIGRILLIGDPSGCGTFKRVVGERLSLPLQTPSVFDGLRLPPRAGDWKERYCANETAPVFLTALGAALAVLEAAE